MTALVELQVETDGGPELFSEPNCHHLPEFSHAYLQKITMAGLVSV